MGVIVDDSKDLGREKKISFTFCRCGYRSENADIDFRRRSADIAGTWDTQIAQYAALGAASSLTVCARAWHYEELLSLFWRGALNRGHVRDVSTPARRTAYNKQIYQQCGDALRARGTRSRPRAAGWRSSTDTPKFSTRGMPMASFSGPATCRCKAGISRNFVLVRRQNLRSGDGPAVAGFAGDAACLSMGSKLREAARPRR